MCSRIISAVFGRDLILRVIYLQCQKVGKKYIDNGKASQRLHHELLIAKPNSYGLYIKTNS